MKRSLFPVRVLWKLIIAFVLALCLVSARLEPVSALSPQDYFTFSYNVQFSRTQVEGSSPFQATVEAEATCINDLPVSATEASITGRIVAEHQVSGTRVTLNSSYTVTIDPFPSRSGNTTRIQKVISLQFPQGSTSGTYNIIAELIEAKVKAIIWINVTSFLPSSQTVGSITYVSAGGGGGGGGGAPTPSPTTSVTISGLSASVNLQVSSSGVVKETSRLEVSFMPAYFDIAAGTKLLDAQGKALSSLSASKIDTPPAPPAGTAIIATVDLGPNGTVFDPAITLVLSYDPAALPEGVTTDKLFIAYWDNAQWQTLPSAIDTAAKTISAAISHFTQFAVMGKLPSSPTSTPSQVSSPSQVTPPSQTLPPPQAPPPSQVLPLPEALPPPQALPPSPSTPLPLSSPVLEPARFTIATLAITPSEVVPDQQVTISAIVTNAGSSRGEYLVVLKINDVEEARKRVIFDALVTQKVSFEVAKNFIGEYQVDVNGLVGSFMVKEAAAKPVSSPQETPLPPKQPQPFSWWLISGIIAGVIIGGAVIWLTVRRRTA